MHHYDFVSKIFCMNSVKLVCREFMTFYDVIEKKRTYAKQIQNIPQALINFVLKIVQFRDNLCLNEIMK